MLEGVPDLTLVLLNEATQAWVELEYNRTVHSETREPPLARCLAGPDVGRPSPASDALRAAFTQERRAPSGAATAPSSSRAPLRGALALPPPRAADRALRALGPLHVHLLDRALGRVGSAASTRWTGPATPDGLRRPLTPLLPPRRRSRAQRRGHRAAPREADGPGPHERSAAGLLPKDDLTPATTTRSPHEQEAAHLYGLKWNPFAPDLPVEALLRHGQARQFLLARRAPRSARAASPPSPATPAPASRARCGSSPSGSPGCAT